jgi:hypothetical protein
MLSRQPFRLSKCAATAALIALGSFASGTAAAAPGDHLRAGNLVVTPGLGVGLEFRSNAFRTPSNPSASGIGVLIPRVQAKLEGPDVLFTGQARYSLQKYLFLSNTPDAVRAQRIAALDRFNNFSVNAGLDVARGGPVGLQLNANSTLNNNPVNIDLDSDDPYTTSFNNVVGAGLVLRPGPALSITPGFQYRWTQFFVPENDANRDPFNTRQSYVPQLNAAWQFLPRTRLVFNSSYTLNRWADQTPEIGGANVAVNNSNLGRATIGVQGRITERLRLLANVGSGFGRFVNSTSLGAVDGLLANLQASYAVTEQHSINAAVRKSFFDSFFTNSVSIVALSGGWNGSYGDNKLVSNLTIGTRFEDYDGPLQRRDQVTNINARLGYNFTPWAQGNLGGGFLQRASPDNPLVEFEDVNVRAQMNFTY